MTGRDSSDDRSAGNIVLLALAAFSTSYNLPVYLHYNNTYRRAYVRMLRCQSGQGCTADATPSNRSNRTQAAVSHHGGTSAARSGSTCSPPVHAVRRELQVDQGSPEPSTSQVCRNTLGVPQTPVVVWSHRPNTEQLDESDSRVVIQRY